MSAARRVPRDALSAGLAAQARPAVRRLLVLAVAVAAALGGAGDGAAAATDRDPRMAAALERLRAGEADAARATLEQIVAGEPGHGPARFHLGRLALERDRWAEAEEHLTIAVAGTLPRPYAAWHLLGRARLLAGDAGGAREAFDRALERAPRFGPALLERARAAIFLGDDPAALADLERAAAQAESRDEALGLAAGLLVYLGREAEARQALAGAAGGDPATSLLRLALEGSCAIDDPLAAEVGRRPDQAEGYLALGIACLGTGRAERAVPALRIAFEIDDRNPLTARFLEQATGVPAADHHPAPYPLLAEEMATALRLADTGRHPEAAAHAAAILEARPHHVPAALLLLRDAERRGALWPALEGYQQLAGWLPEVADIRLRLARVGLALGAHDLAACAAARVLEARPGDGEVWFLRALALAAAGETAGALEAGRRALDLGYRTARVLVTLGDLLHRQMRIAESIAAYSEALSLDPAAAESIASFALASLTSDELAALRPVLERHAAGHPGAVNSLYALGVMALRDGEPQAALGHLERVASLAPAHLEVHYNLALAHRQLGDLAASRRALARFEELEASRGEAWREHHRAHELRLEAREAVAAGDPRSALRIFSGLAAAGTAELEDHLAAGAAALAAGEPGAAAAWFEGVLETRPVHLEALAGLAAAESARGRDDEARRLERRLALVTAPCEAPPGPG